MNKFLAPRSIDEWLILIPYDNLKKRAIANNDKAFHAENHIQIAPSLSEAISCAFDWSKTPEGLGFWGNVFDIFYNMERSVGKIKEMNNITLENIHSSIRYKRDIVPKYTVGYAINGQMIFWQEDNDLLIQYDHAPGGRKPVAGFRRTIKPTLPPYEKFEIFIEGNVGSKLWKAMWHKDQDTTDIGEDGDAIQAVIKTGYCSDEPTAKLLLKTLGINY